MENKSKKINIKDLPELLIGYDTIIPTVNGPMRYINFDNAASTPTFTNIAESVSSFLRWYSNVHRGTGFKSQLSSWAFEKSRDIVAEFVKANLKKTSSYLYQKLNRSNQQAGMEIAI